MSWVGSPDKCQVTMHNLENSPPLFSSFFHYVHSLWTFFTTIFYCKKETPISLERVRKDLGTLLESWTISRRYWLVQPSNNNNNALKPMYTRMHALAYGSFNLLQTTAL